jgi:hypothetical protein
MTKNKTVQPASQATPDQIAEWQAKYGTGNIIELQAEGKFCYVFPPQLIFRNGNKRLPPGAKALASLSTQFLIIAGSPEMNLLKVTKH